MKMGRVVSAVAGVLGALSLGCSTQRAARVLGAPSSLGNGTVASYAEFDGSGAPKAIGVVFSPPPWTPCRRRLRRASVLRRQQ